MECVFVGFYFFHFVLHFRWSSFSLVILLRSFYLFIRHFVSVFTVFILLFSICFCSESVRRDRSSAIVGVVDVAVAVAIVYASIFCQFLLQYLHNVKSFCATNETSSKNAYKNMKNISWCLARKNIIIRLLWALCNCRWKLLFFFSRSLCCHRGGFGFTHH